MANVTVMEHPVLKHFLSLMREKETKPPQFRYYLSQISKLLAYEATKDLDLGTKSIETPMEKIKDAPIITAEICLATIMRAGNGMLESVLELFPFASVGHIGLYRDSFVKSTVEYFLRLPDDVKAKPVFLLDPMLATGDTAIAAIQRLKDCGVGHIRFLCLLASPEGLSKVESAHPDTEVFCVSIERELNDKGYLLPGIGDAGDRIYGTMH